MYTKYLKKLTPQELGYRHGRLTTGQYFYISKSAIGTFFSELDKTVLNDFLSLEFNDPLEDNKIIQASFVFHNDKYARKNGTRNEYRIYLNRDIAKHDLHFEPNDIIVFKLLSKDKYQLEHYKPASEGYKQLEELISENKVCRGQHALLS